MFFQHLAKAIDIAGLPALDDLSRTLWKAHGAAHVSDGEADVLSVQIEVRRAALRQGRIESPKRPPLPRGLYPQRRGQRSPDRARSIGRRRTLAAGGVMPPAMAAAFTVGELAALGIIATECGPDGVCDCSIAEIAARAVVARTTVQNAVREAGKRGLLLMTERRRPMRPSLTNLIRIVSEDWKLWLKRGKLNKSPKNKEFFGKSRGFKKLNRTDRPSVFKSGQPHQAGPPGPSGRPSAAA